MISKYNSTCHFCHRPTKAGVDQYHVVEKLSYHEACHDNVQAMDQETAQDEPNALADRLGFERTRT